MMKLSNELKSIISALLLESKKREAENELHEKEILEDLFEEFFNK